MTLRNSSRPSGKENYYIYSNLYHSVPLNCDDISLVASFRIFHLRFRRIMLIISTSILPLFFDRRSVASAPENISCLSTSVANPLTEDMIYGDEQCVSPNLPRGNPAPMPSQASDFSYDVFRIQSPTNTMEAMDFNHLKETRGGSKASKDIEPDDPLAGSPSTASSVKSAKTKKSDDVGIAPDAKTGKSKKRPRVPPPSTSPSSSPSYSLVPSKSAAPSDAPSVSTSPSTSAVPTNIPTYSPTFTPTYNPT